MKTLFTCLLTICTLPLLAQVTLDQNSFPRPAGFLDVFAEGAITGVSLPTEGTGQSWNYGNIQLQTNFQTQWIDASGDLDFPNALNYRDIQLSFAGFIIEGHLYENVDADGWYDEGWILQDTTYSITPMTGGPNDVLHFPGQAQDFQGRVNYVDFPVAFGNTWTQSHVEITDFNLTVAAFGLNNTPGQQQRIFTQTRTVVGEGTLVIPDENGNPSEELDALLIKAENTTDVDSFFLGGQPAPEALVAAFGQTQGQVTDRDDFYVFYVPGYPTVVLNLNLDANGNLSGVYYRPSAAALATSIGDEAKFNSLKSYPNPIAAGEVMNIDMMANANGATVELIDVTGRQVFSMPILAGAATARFTLPSHLVTGIYTIVVRGSDAELLTTNKLIVK